jgi:hypothetical protein
MVVQSPTDHLCRVYGVSPRYFPLTPLVGREDIRANVINNLGDFLTNDYVQKLLLEARDTVFSRDDSDTPEQRFGEVMEAVTRMFYNFSEPRDFSTVMPSTKMASELRAYSRKQKESTIESRRIIVKLGSIFGAYKEQLSELCVRPSLYGSARYGDAGPNSDIDLKFLVCLPDGEHKIERHEKEVKDLVESIETNIDEGIWSSKSKAQIRDHIFTKDLIVDLDELSNVLMDIEDEATTCLEDYDFKGQDFYPYSWIREGTPVISGLGQIDTKTKKIKKRLINCAKKDPFFEFLMSFSYYFSIEKRQQNLNRT